MSGIRRVNGKDKLQDFKMERRLEASNGWVLRGIGLVSKMMGLYLCQGRCSQLEC